MLTKKDIDDYLKQLYTIERRMEKNYLELAQDVSESGLSKMFAMLASEEKGHGHQLEKLRGLFLGGEMDV